jgi:hypothetical protein
MIRFENKTGNPTDTKVTNAETGEDLSKIVPIKYGARITVGKDGVTAECEIAIVSFEISARKTVFKALNPVTGQYGDVRALEFSDGARVEISEAGVPEVKRRAEVASFVFVDGKMSAETARQIQNAFLAKHEASSVLRKPFATAPTLDRGFAWRGSAKWPWFSARRRGHLLQERVEDVESRLLYIERHLLDETGV